MIWRAGQTFGASTISRIEEALEREADGAGLTTSHRLAADGLTRRLVLSIGR
jgi:hypothetical protein